MCVNIQYTEDSQNIYRVDDNLAHRQTFGDNQHTLSIRMMILIVTMVGGVVVVVSGGVIVTAAGGRR